MKFQFVIFDGVQELDLVGSWELVGSLADQKVCELPELVTLNEMTPVARMGCASLRICTSRMPRSVMCCSYREVVADG